jgi:hypothetical protein
MRLRLYARLRPGPQLWLVSRVRGVDLMNHAHSFAWL